MFEKEAKKWVRENIHIEHSASFGEIKVYPSAENGFQAGAEFGYNEGFKDCAKSRLNVTTISDCPIKDDWHYVKDGDYPKDESKVLCILGDFENDNLEVGYYSQVEGDSKRWRFEDYDLPDDSENGWGVSAWKEIVLPKESE